MGKTMNYLNSLNDAQYEAATTLDGPMLMLAGAGAGKTHTIITRVAYMIEQGVLPSEMLLLTFTNKAAEEMISRAIKYCGETAKNITACTYHSFYALMLRRYGKAIGIRTDFNIITPPECVDAIGYTKAMKGKEYSLRGFPQNKVVANIFSAVVNQNSTIRNIIQANSKWQKFEKYILQLENLYQDYGLYKQNNGLMDYDDLMINFYKLLNENENVRSYIENTYRYIMVDEYQDTNDLQSDILKAMRKTCKNIAVVGDDAQSIYKFRGANVRNIIDFPNDYVGCKTVHLTENYRSSNEILALANTSYALHATEGFPKKMHGQFNTGFKPVVIRPWNSAVSDEEVLKGIKDIIQSGVSPEDVCVIARNSRAFFSLEQMLNENRISYEKRGGAKFLELEEVLDMIAYLRISVDSTNALSLFRVMKHLPDVGEVRSRAICDLIGVVDKPLIDNKYKNYKFFPELKFLNKALEKSREIPNEDPVRKFKYFQKFYFDLRTRVIESMNTDDESHRTEKLQELEVKKANVRQMLSLIEKYDTVTKFLDAIVLDQSRVDDAEVNNIILTTIHSVKGLEFDTVFILDCVNGVFPRSQSWEIDYEEEQEELRCFYVAVTRAKKRLYIMAPKRIRGFTNSEMFADLTRFLDGCEQTYTESDFYIPFYG